MDVTAPRGGAAQDHTLQKGLGPSGSSQGCEAARLGPSLSFLQEGPREAVKVSLTKLLHGR